MKNTRTYRSEAPIKIYQIGFSPVCFKSDVTAGRRTTIHGFGKTAQDAYKTGISAYRKELRRGLIVPAIIDENGAAL